MRLYFFPGLLPIAAILPGVLSLVGSAAALMHAASRRSRRAWLVAAIGIAGTLGYAAWLAAVQLGGRPLRPAEAPARELLPAQATGGAWNQPLPRPPLSTPALSEKHGLLIVGTSSGTVDAISVRDATLRFAWRMDAPVLAEPLVSEDRVYVGEGLHDTPRSRLVALSLPEGKPLWAASFDSHLEAAPRLSPDGGTLWGCAGDAGAYAIDASSGKTRWQRALGHCDTTPLWVDGTIYLLAESATIPARSRLWALDADTGEPGWSVELPGQPWGTPRLDAEGTGIWVTTGVGDLSPRASADERGWLHRIGLPERATRWSRPLGGMPLLSNALATAEGRTLILQGLKKGEIAAFDARDGAELWRTRLASPLLSEPRLLPTGRFALALGYDGTFYELDVGSGAIRSRRLAGLQSSSAPVLGQAHAYCATREGIWALPYDPRTGALQ